MRAIGVRSFGGPETFEILDVPIPEISNPDDILVRVKAFSINPGDGIRAAGWGRILETVK
jgi:NADPH:quinone reductase-like Zn-dependent oxidoreductase